MDSDWNSSSFSPGTLDCLLCKDSLKYENGDRTEFINHLKNVHQTKFHHNLILAITFFDNDNLNDIVSQFEKTSRALNLNAEDYVEKNKSVGKQIAEVFGIDADDEGLLLENEDIHEADNDIVENGSPNKSFELINIEAIKVEKKIHQCESCEKSFTNRAALNKHTSKNHQKSSTKRKLETTNDELPASKKIKRESTEETIDYDYIVSCSEYFKKNPKQITTKCNIALHSMDVFQQVDPLFPAGWKLREHTKSDGILEKHFLSPDGRVLKSRRAAMEYMSILGKYTAEEIRNVKDGDGTIKKKRNSLESKIGNIRAIENETIKNTRNSLGSKTENIRAIGNGTIKKKRNSLESKIENIKAIQKQNVERESVIMAGVTVRTDLMGVKKEPMDASNDASETRKTAKVAKIRKSTKLGSNDFAKSIKTFGDLWNHLKPIEDETDEDGPKTGGKKKPEKKRKSVNGSPGQAKPSRRSGVGVECPECHKVVGALRRHLEDIHSPPGHFPCPGCKKVFTSRNRQSSHTSRNCNPNKPKK